MAGFATPSRPLLALLPPSSAPMSSSVPLRIMERRCEMEEGGAGLQSPAKETCLDWDRGLSASADCTGQRRMDLRRPGSEVLDWAPSESGRMCPWAQASGATEVKKFNVAGPVAIEAEAAARIGVHTTGPSIGGRGGLQDAPITFLTARPRACWNCTVEAWSCCKRATCSSSSCREGELNRLSREGPAETSRLAPPELSAEKQKVLGAVSECGPSLGAVGKLPELGPQYEDAMLWAWS